MRFSPTNERLAAQRKEAAFRAPFEKAANTFKAKRYEEAESHALKARANGYDEPTRREAGDLLETILLDKAQAAFDLAWEAQDWDAALSAAKKAVAVRDNESTRKLVASAKREILTNPHYFGACFKQIARTEPLPKQDDTYGDLKWNSAGTEIRAFHGDDRTQLRVFDPVTLNVIRASAGPSSPSTLFMHAIGDTRSHERTCFLENEIVVDINRGVKVTRMTSSEVILNIPEKQSNNPASFAVSKDGRFLALGGQMTHESVILYDMVQKRQVWEHMEAFKDPIRNRIGVSSIAFSADGRFIATSSRLGLAVRDSSDGKILGRVPLNHDDYDSREILGVSNSGKEIVAVQHDFITSDLTFLNLASGEESEKVSVNGAGRSSVVDLNLQSEAVAILLSGSSGYEIEITHIRTAKVLGKISVERGVKRISLSPDGRKLAIGYYDGSVSVWGVCSDN